nr:MAG TPA: hypothetical protein [Caudoviricetes sp.]
MPLVSHSKNIQHASKPCRGLFLCFVIPTNSVLS